MFVILQNDPQCPPGGLTGVLASSGHPFRVIASYGEEAFPAPGGLTGAVVLGGEMGVHDTGSFPYLERVRLFLGEALHADLPVLGICLGGQLLAQVAGGLVSSPSRHREQGVCRVDLSPQGALDPLFHGVPSPFFTFQLHNDSFSVPPGGTLLATSAACPAQAFRLGTHAYGLQFHPEVDRAIVADWGGMATPPADFLGAFLANEAPFRLASGRILANFLSLAADASLR